MCRATTVSVTLGHLATRARQDSSSGALSPHADARRRRCAPGVTTRPERSQGIGKPRRPSSGENRSCQKSFALGEYGRNDCQRLPPRALGQVAAAMIRSSPSRTFGAGRVAPYRLEMIGSSHRFDPFRFDSVPSSRDWRNAYSWLNQDRADGKPQERIRPPRPDRREPSRAQAADAENAGSLPKSRSYAMLAASILIGDAERISFRVEGCLW